MKTRFSNDTLQALQVAFSGSNRRFLIFAALIPLLMAMLIPMINVHIIYPAFTNVIVQSIAEDARQLAIHELPAALKHTKLTRETLTDRFFGQIYRLEHDFNLYKIRVYSPEGTILYSTDVSEIGQVNTRDYFHEIVAKGQTFTQMIEKNEVNFEGKAQPVDLVESYVPFMKRGVFLGAFEMYFDVSKRTQRLAQVTFYSQLAMISLAATLFLSVLFFLKTVASRQQEHDRANALKEDVERITRHDLKSPIISLSNGIEYLASFTELTEEQTAITVDMRKAAVTAMEIINRSLDLYKMEQGTYVFSPAPMDFIAVVKRVTEDLSQFARAKDVTILVTHAGNIIGQSDKLQIESEETLCYSLVANLIKNGIEASLPNDHVTVTLAMSGHLRLTIHNTQPVPEDIRDTFFEKYSTAGKSDGTGLGTYSAKLLTMTMGGTIDMTTSNDDGTIITVTLPVLSNAISE